MMRGSEILRFLPLGLILLGLTCLLIAALTPVSPRKGSLRLAASLMVAAAFCVGSTSQMFEQHRAWPGIVGSAAGLFLAYVGQRKHIRDPDGRTPVDRVL